MYDELYLECNSDGYVARDVFLISYEFRLFEMFYKCLFKW